MNRLHHIRETLPANIKENDFPESEFVLLDYNSTDGLDDYIRNNFEEELRTGKLVYYKYKDADAFQRCHARNMALQLAKGAILCNVDADNFLGPSFDKYVLEFFSTDKKTCLTGLNNAYAHDASGKLCLSKDDFFNVTGYDENFVGYGFEDFDLVNRIQLNGTIAFTINVSSFLRTIRHGPEERLRHDFSFRQIEKVFVRYIDHSSSEILFLFKNKTCAIGNIVNNFTRNCNSPHSPIVQKGSVVRQFEVKGGWQQGSWSLRPDTLHINYWGKEQRLTLTKEGHYENLENEELMFYPVENLSLLSEAAFFYSESYNRELMDRNFSERKIQPNKSFGKGIVFKNFNEQAPIEI